MPAAVPDVRGKKPQDSVKSCVSLRRQTSKQTHATGWVTAFKHTSQDAALEPARLGSDLALSLTGCVATGQLLNLSVPRILKSVKRGDNDLLKSL